MWALEAQERSMLINNGRESWSMGHFKGIFPSALELNGELTPQDTLSTPSKNPQLKTSLTPRKHAYKFAEIMSPAFENAL